MIKLPFLFSLIFFVFSAHGQNMKVLNAFKQGSSEGTGNCASIALIKASIDRYGTGNIFMSVKDSVSKKYFVMLQSGKELVLTFDEIEQAAQAAGFIRSKDPSLITIAMYADTCFAVLAKHIQIDQTLRVGSNYSTFKEALADLNDGFSTCTIANVLGLEIEPFKARAKVIRQKSGAVVYNKYHAAYATYGIYDEAGDNDGQAPIEKFKFKRADWKCGFIFCGPSDAFEVKGK